MSKLNHKDLYLEKISSKHIDEGWLEWLNSASNQRETLNRPPHKYNRKQLYKYLKDLKKKKDLMFAVRIKKNNTYVGNLRISDIDNYNKNCVYGRLLGNTKYRGKGFGLLFLYKICEIAFEKLKMNKIFTHVYADNYRAVANNLKFGMRIGGYFKSHFRKKNRFKDVYFIELTKEEFKKIKKNFK